MHPRPRPHPHPALLPRRTLDDRPSTPSPAPSPQMPDWAEARRDPIPLPVTGCAAAKVYPGGRPPRFNKHMYSSSSMVGGWWNDPLFAELNRRTSPYPYPTSCPTPSPRPRLAPHLRHALLLARVSLPSVHAVPSPVRAPPPFPLATFLLPRSTHRPPHRRCAAGHGAHRCQSCRQSGRANRPRPRLAPSGTTSICTGPTSTTSSCVNGQPTPNRIANPNPNANPNPKSPHLPVPEPGTASCALFRSSSGASLRSRTCQPQTGCCEHSEPRGLSVRFAPARGHRPEGDTGVILVRPYARASPVGRLGRVAYETCCTRVYKYSRV